VRGSRGNPAWFLVGPALGIIALFFIVPVAASFLLSLTDFDGRRRTLASFAGKPLVSQVRMPRRSRSYWSGVPFAESHATRPLVPRVSDFRRWVYLAELGFSARYDVLRKT